MAKFEIEIPKDLMKQFNALYKDTDKIFGDMTRAGAEAVMKQMKANIPEGFKDSEIMKCLKITKVYKTPTDGGINCKVGFFGYFYNHNEERVPAELVVNVMEYGRSSSDYPKTPFIRKCFKKGIIKKAMYNEIYEYVLSCGFTGAEATEFASEIIDEIIERHGG